MSLCFIKELKNILKLISIRFSGHVADFKLIRFRKNPIVLIGKMKKMYNSVLLEELEKRMHRFL